MLHLHVNQARFDVLEPGASEPIISFDSHRAAEQFILDVLALDATPIVAARTAQKMPKAVSKAERRAGQILLEKVDMERRRLRPAPLRDPP